MLKDVSVLFVLAFLIIGCDRDSTVSPTPITSISVTWPLTGSGYYMGEGIRIKWEKSPDIERVSVTLVRVDGPFGDDSTEGALLFSGVPGNEVLWREWWLSPLDVPEGTYFFRVEVTDTLAFGSRIGDDSDTISFIRSFR